MTRTLVLLHGFTGTPESWEGLRPFLPSAVRLHAEPLLGHSPELLTEGTGGFEAEVDRLVARVRARLDSPIEWVGYSLGARLALGVAVRHPALVHRLWLVGVHPGLSSPTEREERRRADAGWVQVLQAEGMPAFVARWEAQPLFASQRALPERVRDAERFRRLSHTAQGLALALRALGLGAMPDLGPKVPALQMPVEVLAGEWDIKFRQLADPLVAAIPRATLTVVPSAGHNVILEQPQALAAALMEVRA
jgi:2-succinyl-6-hydroxy-2,4-cyclohexadiene-1-carboxylate synthase